MRLYHVKLVIDLCDSDEDGGDRSSPVLPTVYEQNEVFEKKVLHFFEEFPLVKRSSSDAEMNELLVANCNTLTNMKRMYFQIFYLSSMLLASALRRV